MKTSIATYLASLDQLGKKAIRFAIVIVFIWIGGLKFFAYEADGIVPFVANSPFMSFFYQHPESYKTHQGKEGELIAANRQWNTENNTYGFSYGLGIFLIGLGVLLALYQVVPFTSMLATPESWVPHLSDAQWGFPYLSGRGRLVVKDLVILGGAIITMSESARIYLNRKKN